MKKIKLIFSLFLLSFLGCYSQNILVLGGDTLITLQLPEVRKINAAFFENKSLKQQVALCDSIIFYKNLEITDYKKVIAAKNEVLNFQDELVSEANKVIEKQSEELKKEKKKKKWYFATGVISGSLLTLLIVL